MVEHVNARIGTIRGMNDGNPTGLGGRGVLITPAEGTPAGAYLWYARGFFPVTSLVHQEGFPAPAFGPVAP